jgi:hypothetical protein
VVLDKWQTYKLRQKLFHKAEMKNLSKALKGDDEAGEEGEDGESESGEDEDEEDDEE